jgi:hypothetical protein
MAEREAVGQAAAEMPVLVGWEIKHTPGPRDDAGEALEFVSVADLFVVVLGADFAAPMGLEWELAGGRMPDLMTYRKRVMTSPSAQSFLRRSSVDWVLFDEVGAFKARLASDLGRAILDRAEQFGLHLGEVEALMKRLAADKEPADAEPDDRRGAERGGVILGLRG